MIFDREILDSPAVSTRYFSVNDHDGKEELWRLFHQYDRRRSRSNYSRVAFEHLIAENRFDFGAITTTVNGEAACFCGIHNHKGWAMITRFAILKYFTIPFTSGCMLPKLIEVAKDAGMKGVSTTFNMHNKSLMDMFLRPDWNLTHDGRPRDPEVNNSEIFKKAIEIAPLFRKLDYTVLYRGVEQYVAYLPFGDELPEFDKVKSI